MMFMALCLVSFASFSQQAKPDPEARAKKISEKMKTELSLSDEQYTKVYDINLKYSQKMKDIRTEEGDRQSKMNSIRDLNKSKNDELKSVLSEEQMNKYRDMQKDMRNKSREHRKQG